MLGLASQKTVERLAAGLAALQLTVERMELRWTETVAGLENAADLYSRAAARHERSKPPANGTRGASLEDIRARRGGY